MHDPNNPAATSSPTPADAQAVADRINAGVEKMDRSQRVDAATMRIEFNPAPPDTTRVAGERRLLTPEELADIERFQQQRRKSPVPTDAWLYVAEALH